MGWDGGEAAEQFSSKNTRISAYIRVRTDWSRTNFDWYKYKAQI